MSKSPPPELVQAHTLIKSGQRQAAHQVLKTYLDQNPRDADGWWLMAHAVSQPENVQKCLERVLRINPRHEKARARLAELTPSPIVDDSDPDDDEPDESFFVIKPPATSRQDTAPAAESSMPGGKPDASDPFAAFPASPGSKAQVSGAFPGERPKPPRPKSRPAPAPAMAVNFAPTKEPRLKTMVRAGMIAFALVALVGAVVFIANWQGWVHLWGLPPMARLNGASFSLEYPKAWHSVCKADLYGYPVCGIANHSRYNQVDYYTGQDIDIAGIFSDALSFGNLFGLEKTPDMMVSVIAMDVLESSPAYDRTSMAKMMNDTTARYGYFYDSGKSKITYDERLITVDGRAGFYYRFSIESMSGGVEQFLLGSSGNLAYFDVYVPHDDRMFWLTVYVVTSKRGTDIPEDIVQHMIDSITIS